MRFLLFNVTVLAALAYLFMADGDQVRSAAGSAHRAVERAGGAAMTAAENVTDYVGSQADAVRDRLSGERAQVQTESGVAPEPEAPEVASVPPARPPVPAEEAVATAPEPVLEASPAAAGESGGPTVLAPKKASEMPQARWVDPVPVTKPQLPPAVPENVAKGESVTPGMVPPPPAPAPASTKPSSGAKQRVELAEGTELMSPRERRRALHAMAEDMEYLFLEKAGR